jgi:hypothetical protein
MQKTTSKPSGDSINYPSYELNNFSVTSVDLQIKAGVRTVFWKHLRDRKMNFTLRIFDGKKEKFNHSLHNYIIDY